MPARARSLLVFVMFMFAKRQDEFFQDISQCSD